MVPFNDVMLPPQSAASENINRIALNKLPANQNCHCEASIIVGIAVKENVSITHVMTTG